MTATSSTSTTPIRAPTAPATPSASCWRTIRTSSRAARLARPANISYRVPRRSRRLHACRGQTRCRRRRPRRPRSWSRTTPQPDGSTAGGRGAITYGQAPSGPFAFSARHVRGAGRHRFRRSRHDHRAGHRAASRFDMSYSTEFTLAATQQDALTAEDAFPGGDGLVQCAFQRRDGQLLAGHGYR